MGAWGIKNFENDGAADFVEEVIDNGSKAIKTCLLKITKKQDDAYLDTSDCEEALAAAEIIAAAKGKPSEDCQDQILEWVKSNDALHYRSGIFGKKIDITDLTVKAVNRIVKNSELR